MFVITVINHSLTGGRVYREQPIRKLFWLYIIHLSDNTHYTGITSKTVPERLKTHHNDWLTRKLEQLSDKQFIVSFIATTRDAKMEVWLKSRARIYCRVCSPTYWEQLL